MLNWKGGVCVFVTVYGVRKGEEDLYRSYSAELGFSVVLVYEEPTLENLCLAEGSSAVLIRTRQFPRPYVEKLKEMGIRYLCTRSVGTDHIDADACREMGIEYTGVNYSPDTVAEFAVMLMLMGIRKLPMVMKLASVQDCTLTKAKRGRELRDCVVGVIGTGRIGRRVVELLQAFGSEVIAYSHTASVEGIEYVTLDELLGRSDIITLHIPGQARPVLGSREFSLMKDGVVLVNTARGSLIDQEALLGALESGKVGTALLDVLVDEKIMYHLDKRGVPVPNRYYNILRSFPQVHLTPHMAFFTDGAVDELARHSLEWVRDRIFNC